MMKRHSTLATLGALAALALAGCAPIQQQYPPSTGTAAGAGTGALVGGVLGNVLSADGRRTENTVIGAALGAALGGGVGYAVDRQQQSANAALAAERARSQAEVDELRREVASLQRQRALDRYAETHSTSGHLATADAEPPPLRVVIAPNDEPQVASEW